VREEKGKFTTFDDFCNRADLRKINKRMIESLIKCGVFDSLGYRRSQLMKYYEGIVDTAQRRQKERSSGQASFFDHMEGEKFAHLDVMQECTLSDIAEWDHKELLAHEKETLGFYITGHPLLRFAEKLHTVANVDTASINDKNDRDTVAFGGVVSNIREVTTKRKEVMAYITIEDLRGSVTVICFADLYGKAFGLVHSEDPVLVKGAIDAGEEGIKVIASEIIPLGDAVEQPYDVVHFTVDASRTSAADIESLHKLLTHHKGKCEGFIRIVNGNSDIIVHLGRDLQIELTDKLKEEGDSLLGAGATRFSHRTIERE
jgi:DNA polymerase-3 subunit alpha